ncbi:MAG: sensor histidine kinase N-terminal domain-containing protein [Planctomycetota bacterium]
MLPIVCLGVAVHWHFERRLLVRVFDAQLAQRAKALASLVVAEHGRLGFDFVEDYLPEYSQESRQFYFEIWGPGGQRLARSPSLLGAELPRDFGTIDAPAAFDGGLPDGTQLRSVGVHFPRRIGSDNGGAPLWVDVVIAAPTAALRASLRGGLVEVLTIGLVSALAIIVAVALTLRRGSKALDDVVQAVQALDPQELGALSLQEVPTEIWPLVRELNRHMRITSDVLEQERSFNANVAHELRTPISEIRATTDVALRFPGTVDPEVALREAHGVALRMGRTVEALLRLARLQAVEPSEEDTTVPLAALVRRSFEGRPGGASEPGRVRVSTPGQLLLPRGGDAWAIVVDNLADNALEYAPAGSTIDVRLVSHAGEVALTVENDAPNLVPDDLRHLTQRLWRGRASSSAAGHAGLGLSIVAAACRRLGAELEFTLHDGRLRVRVALPSAAPA